jgi:serine/threonine-protein kinase
MASTEDDDDSVSYAGTGAHGPRARAQTGAIDELLAEGMVIAERYRIGDLLGEGGMGAVYFAKHLTVGRSVAVKVLAAQWCGVPKVTQRFRDEARAASAAGHPNIIEVFDAGELPDGRPYLVMEHLEGRELADVITRHGRLEVKRACRIIRDVARALDAAHTRGVIHRDLKGENVMLVERGGEEIVKVLDFGIAANNASLGPRATTPGLIMGTPAYMAPEQAGGAPATIAFDIYALGVLLHEALTGRTPFQDADGVALLVAKTSKPAPSIATLLADLPPALVELVDSCLAMDPSLRPATAREVAERLLEIIEGRQAAEPTVEPTLVVPPRRSAATPLWWRVGIPVVGLVLLLSLVAGVLGLRELASEDATDASIEPPLAPEMPEGVVAKVDDGGAPLPPVPGAAGVEPSVDASAGSDPVPASAVDEPLPSIGRPDATKPVADEPLPSVGPPDDEPAASVADSGLCWRTRKQAQQAREGHDWMGVLRHTRNQSCWTEQRDQRQRLRTKAHMELGQWGECLDASRSLRDAEGRQWQEICRRRKEQG